MREFLFDPDVTIYQGDALEALQTFDDESVNCVVTSPPYWRLRDYSVDGQIGLEEDIDEYINKLVSVFREVRRVLHRSGTCWVNVGDIHCTWGGCERFKPKDLVGVPWLLALSLRDDGWFLRHSCVWAKPNPLPESVVDRPSTAHEYVFLLSKSRRYFYDRDAPSAMKTTIWSIATEQSHDHFAAYPTRLVRACIDMSTPEYGVCSKCLSPYERIVNVTYSGRRNNRSDGKPWFVSGYKRRMERVAETSGWKETCSCSEGVSQAIVLDPFLGYGTTAYVARKMGRRCVGIELNPDYCEIASRRLSQLSLLAQV